MLMYDEPTHAYMRELRDELDEYLKNPGPGTGSFLTLRVGDLHYTLEQQDRARRIAARTGAARRLVRSQRVGGPESSSAGR
jgi:hypothetical protein